MDNFKKIFDGMIDEVANKKQKGFLEAQKKVKENGSRFQVRESSLVLAIYDTHHHSFDKHEVFVNARHPWTVAFFGSVYNEGNKRFEFQEWQYEKAQSLCEMLNNFQSDMDRF